MDPNTEGQNNKIESSILTWAPSDLEGNSLWSFGNSIIKQIPNENTFEFLFGISLIILFPNDRRELPSKSDGTKIKNELSYIS